MGDTAFALPATRKQIAYARSLALKNQAHLSWEVQQDRHSLSACIEAQARIKQLAELDRLPSSKQVAFGKRLARIKRRTVPEECFRDREPLRRLHIYSKLFTDHDIYFLPFPDVSGLRVAGC
jgi:hypothetical protein